MKNKERHFGLFFVYAISDGAQKESKKHHVSFSSSQFGAHPTKRREKLSVTHRSSVLLTLDNLEQIGNVLVEIKDLRSQLKISVAQQVHLFVFLNILRVERERDCLAVTNQHAVGRKALTSL